MAGIYIHIPYCKQACHYCDFHFSTNTSTQKEMHKALLMEIGQQKSYLQNEIIDTIYFGGGTPSLLSTTEINEILDKLKSTFTINQLSEITLEANPDDLSLEKLQELKNAGVNRLSIGIQTFNEAQLHFLNRAHNQEQALSCISNARKVGFENFSIDLIYGLPADDHQNWESDLKIAMDFKPSHISAYCLTIEEKTALGKWQKTGKFKAVEDEFAATQFDMLLATLAQNGYEQYEISNFCLPSFESKHNSSYWLGKKYIGIGPGAHSYDGPSRQYNVSNNSKYIKGIVAGTPAFEKEILSPRDQLNEMVMVKLRTKWGLSLKQIQADFVIDFLEKKPVVQKYIDEGHIILENDVLRLSNKGKLWADKITLDLFFE